MILPSSAPKNRTPMADSSGFPAIVGVR